MRRWFVCSNETYYPYARVVEAESAEVARARAVPAHENRGVAVFPLDALALWEPDAGYPDEPMESLLAPYE